MFSSNSYRKYPNLEDNNPPKIERLPKMTDPNTIRNNTRTPVKTDNSISNPNTVKHNNRLTSNRSIRNRKPTRMPLISSMRRLLNTVNTNISNRSMRNTSMVSNRM